MLTAVTIGKFDGFHLGHRLLLKKLQDFARLGLTPVVLKIKSPGSSLLTDEEEREVLASFGSPEVKVIPFTPEFSVKSPETFVRDMLVGQFQAEEVVVGTDFRFGCQRSGNTDTLRYLGNQYGFGVSLIDKLQYDGDIVSSSRIRSLLSEGRVQEAETLLGYPVRYTGVIRRGKQLGRTLGFPTINLFPHPEKFIPRLGVYSSEVTLETAEGLIKRQGLTNIGMRPTVYDGNQITIETFLMDFSDEVYGIKAGVQLKSFIREEKKFSSVDELQEQMKKDLKSL